MTVFERLRAEYPQLGTDKFLTCVPSCPADESIPHYKIVMVNGHDANVGVPLEEFARRCDDLLGEVNQEYRNKFESGRLGPVRLLFLSWKDFTDRISGTRSKAWETQFKFLPLYRITWENLIKPDEKLIKTPEIPSWDERAASGGISPCSVSVGSIANVKQACS